MARWSAGRRWGLVAGALLVLVVAAVGWRFMLASTTLRLTFLTPQPVYWLLETARERSVVARARDIVVPNGSG